jgi:hypothetical protein
VEENKRSISKGGRRGKWLIEVKWQVRISSEILLIISPTWN